MGSVSVEILQSSLMFSLGVRYCTVFLTQTMLAVFDPHIHRLGWDPAFHLANSAGAVSENSLVLLHEAGSLQPVFPVLCHSSVYQVSWQLTWHRISQPVPSSSCFFACCESKGDLISNTKQSLNQVPKTKQTKKHNQSKTNTKAGIALNFMACTILAALFLLAEGKVLISNTNHDWVKFTKGQK